VKTISLRLWTTQLLSLEMVFVPAVYIYLVGTMTVCTRRSCFCPWRLCLSVFGDNVSLFPHLVVENLLFGFGETLYERAEKVGELVRM
jgi:hypothetical protein